ncbi:MAG: ABC transporter substrate-binding protein [Lachnospiraceae bacterium]|nr:ABC transporter substrate-binding protein [Lachnospiraceae bacterium]
MNRRKVTAMLTAAAMCMTMAGGGLTAKAEVQRDVLNFAISTDPGDFGPWAATNTATRICLWGVYQELATIIDGQEELVLLKSYELSDDGLEMYCEIWDTITDTAGNHMTANDVLFCWETGSELGLLTGTDFVDELEVTGDYTFTFKFNRTLEKGDTLGLFKWKVVTQAAYEASDDGMATDPVGTGPYIVSDYVSGSGFTYTLRDDYWQTDEYNASTNGQNVQTINWYIITESSQRTIALQTGQVDLCQEINSLDLAQFDEGGAYSEDYDLYGISEDKTIQFFANCTEGSVTDDVNLRIAMYYAIDNEVILNSVYGGSGTAVHELMGTWADGYNSDWDTEDNYYNYDVEKAAEYLAASNYNGEELELIVENDENKTNVAQLVQVFLQEIGVNVTISTVEASSWDDYKSSGDWDLLISDDAANVYAVKGWWGVLSQDRYGEERGTVNFIQDETLQDLISAAMAVDATDEDNTAVHDYIIENGYGYGIVNPYMYYVIPSDMTNVVTSYQRAVIPGSCTYEN